MGIEDLNKSPDKLWLIQILSTLKHDHMIFQKDYLPPARAVTPADKVVNNTDNFFNDLPKLFKKRDLKG